MENNHYISDIKAGKIAISGEMKDISANIVSSKALLTNHVSFANYLNELNENEYGKLIAFLDKKIKLK